LVEKCFLLLAAKESFQDAENDLKVLTGIEFGYSTYHWQVKKVDLSPPNLKQTGLRQLAQAMGEI
jgi:hypothetical protein